MIKDLLPIGSIVILQGGVRKLMITGILASSQENADKVYDYIGVLFPEGFMGEVGNYLFDHGDINDVIFKGYDNPERQTFLSFIEENLSEEKIEKEESLEETTTNE